VVVAAGMGAARATLAVQAALSCGPIASFISTGLAGSCTPWLHPGACLEASVIIDVNTGERWVGRPDAVAAHPVVLTTAGTVAGVQEKARLAASYGAAMVDMEAATVARLALAHGLPFRAIKGISDAHDFDFGWESMAPFTDSHGHFRTAAFALHVALRPWSWKKAMVLGRGSALALAALSERLALEVGPRTV